MSQTQKIFLLLASDNARFSVRNLISFLCQLNFKYIYIIGSVVGPHPYPDMVARFQSVISEEIKSQLLEKKTRVLI